MRYSTVLVPHLLELVELPWLHNPGSNDEMEVRRLMVMSSRRKVIRLAGDLLARINPDLVFSFALTWNCTMSNVPSVERVLSHIV